MVGPEAVSPFGLLRGDCVEKVRHCLGLSVLIQSGPGDWSTADDGGTSERAGSSVL